jgi:invasion protein IalB
MVILVMGGRYHNMRHKPLSLLLAISLACLGAGYFPDGVALAQAAGGSGKEAPLKAAKSPDAGVRARGGKLRFSATPWQIQCISGKQGVSCALVRGIVVVGSRRLLLRVSIDGKRNKLNLRLPHGLDLHRNPVLELDGRKAGEVRYLTSLPAGVLASMDAPNSLLKKMASARLLRIVMPLRGDRTLAVGMDLEGFAAALRKLK